jgi:hypothetical protein
MNFSPKYIQRFKKSRKKGCFSKTGSPLQPFPYCGAYLPADLAFQMALGNVDLNSLNIVGFFDPGN